ncbi:DUF222 domain-containing protein [Microbispora hainanensis]|uniref:DUF222 domain-containing protein n=1 Tax=Microbispora hainanensis TaxID=568844 RepID=A0ABZ1SLV6_9ACTN|nr:DUF222 domain-containing protein [Microbispora hainanensis]
MAQELALTPLPDDVDMCLAEAEELLFARDRITSALADRVGRVHRAGQARQHGHASTRCWLRTAAGMTVGGAGRLLTLGAELPRLPVVREKFATGELAAGVVEAICAAVAGLTDEQAGLAEPILVDLAGKAGAAEVAKAGRHLRAVLDPDGEERDERADYGRRFLRVRPGKGGGVEGEFYLPREAGARLMALLQAYAKLRAQGDDRPLTVRQADALIALLEQKIAAELLVVVSAESLPTDPETTDPTDDPYPADPATEDPAAPATDETDPATQDPAAPAAADDVSDHFADLDDSTPSDYAPDTAGSTDEPSQADDTTDHVEDAWDAGGFEEGRDDTGDSAPGEAGADAGAESADDPADHAGDAWDAGGFEEGRDDTGDSAPGEAGADAGAESADDPADHAGDAWDAGGFEEGRDDTGDSAPGEAGADAGAESADDTNAYAPDATGSADDPSQADDAVSDVMGDPGAAGGTDGPETPDELDTAEAVPATDPAAGSGDVATGLRDEEPRGWGAGECGAGERRPGECEPRSTANTAAAEGDHTANADSAEDDDTASTRSAECDTTAPAKGDGCVRGATRSGATHARRGASAWPAHDGGHSHTAPSHAAPSHAAPSDTAPSHAVPSDTASSDTVPSGATASDAPPSQAAPSEAAPSEAAPSEVAPSSAARPDPPPEDVSAHHTHAGPRPAGDCRHGHSTCRCGSQGAWRCNGDARCSCATQAAGTPGTAAGAGRATPETAQEASQGGAQGTAQGGSPGSPGASAGAMPGAFLGSALGASAGTLLGASLGMAPGTAPGVLLATGQVLPVSSVHRLARTSTLVRIVMNADGQVLDMGRKVRLATPAQRRAIFARYATCWIDGCPLPATMCQIDHADNWSTGGLTDLKLLGPACQFHNRDRYQHPDRYTRRNVGEDRWAFTYHRLGRAPRLHE